MAARSSRRIVVTACAVALILAGCGSSSSTAQKASGAKSGTTTTVGGRSAVAVPVSGRSHIYDPSQGIDLSGTPGETLAQQHAAEQLVRESLHDLPRYATEQAAYNAGFRSIGDSLTGDEHMVNWSYLGDKHVLDPMYPESLVYNTRSGTPKLEAAMFMLSLGQRFSDIPSLFRGPLTQWHIHNNLCFRNLGGNPDQQMVAGLTDSQGDCPPAEEKSVPVPMIHVWIVRNPCGPFAALEGVGAGQTQSGQRNCDTGHAGDL
jgi:hypothetical protein